MTPKTIPGIEVQQVKKRFVPSSKYSGTSLTQPPMHGPGFLACQSTTYVCNSTRQYVPLWHKISFANNTLKLTLITVSDKVEVARTCIMAQTDIYMCIPVADSSPELLGAAGLPQYRVYCMRRGDGIPRGEQWLSTD